MRVKFSAIILLLLMTASCSTKCTTSNNGSAVESETVELVEIIEDPPVPMFYYDGDPLHLFFHPLVSHPEIAFTGDMKQFFMDWYITPDELRNILDELYMDNYVLVDIDEFYNVTEVDGVKNLTINKYLVPERKKPMIISIDDLSYYDFTRDNGSVHKLVIDAQGGIAAWTPNENGGELSYDLDVVTVIEGFIKQHPDFSIRGAKGIIALTGYEGVLGYFTHELDSPDYSKTAEEAIAVVNRLKEMGWRFASHSWGHRNMPTRTFASFMWDTNHWDDEVRPILGDTNLFIYPFGAGLEEQEDKHKVLRDRGFDLFFGVGNGFRNYTRGHYIYIDRRNIDGVYFRTFKNRQDKLFDIDKIIDKEYRK